MRSTTANATELRESIMALTRQLRRHRPDNGLPLTQMQVLGEVGRAGITTPAELAVRLQVRVQSLTDGINELEARRLVTRRPDAGDRRCMSCRYARRSPAWSRHMPTGATLTWCGSGSALFAR